MNKCIQLFLAFILLGSCSEPLNIIRSDGNRNYEGKIVRMLYFNTKNEIEPFISMVNKEFNLDSEIDSSGVGVTYRWNRIRKDDWSKNLLKLEIIHSNDFRQEASEIIYEGSTVTIIVIEIENRDLLETDKLELIAEYFQELVMDVYKDN